MPHPHHNSRRGAAERRPGARRLWLLRRRLHLAPGRDLRPHHQHVVLGRVLNSSATPTAPPPRSTTARTSGHRRLRRPRWETEIYTTPPRTSGPRSRPSLEPDALLHHGDQAPRRPRRALPGGGYDNFAIWYSLTNTDVYTPSTGAWTQIASLLHPRRSHATVLLPSGELIVTGGSNGGVDDGTSRHRRARHHRDDGTR